jgi:hypothetical protein
MDTGVDSFRCLQGFGRNLRPPSIYTGDGTPPSKSVSGLSLDAVGVILMTIGGLGLVVSVIVLGTTRARVGRTTVVQGTTPVQGDTTVVQEGGR